MVTETCSGIRIAMVTAFAIIILKKFQVAHSSAAKLQGHFLKTSMGMAESTSAIMDKTQLTMEERLSKILIQSSTRGQRIPFS